MPPETGSLPPFAAGSVCGLGTAFKVQRPCKCVPHSVRDWKLTSTLSGCPKRAQSYLCTHISRAPGVGVILVGLYFSLFLDLPVKFIAGLPCCLPIVVSWKCQPSLIASQYGLYFQQYSQAQISAHSVPNKVIPLKQGLRYASLYSFPCPLFSLYPRENWSQRDIQELLFFMSCLSIPESALCATDLELQGGCRVGSHQPSCVAPSRVENLHCETRAEGGWELLIFIGYPTPPEQIFHNTELVGMGAAPGSSVTGSHCFH